MLTPAEIEKLDQEARERYLKAIADIQRHWYELDENTAALLALGVDEKPDVVIVERE